MAFLSVEGGPSEAEGGGEVGAGPAAKAACAVACERPRLFHKACERGGLDAFHGAPNMGVLRFAVNSHSVEGNMAQEPNGNMLQTPLAILRQKPVGTIVVAKPVSSLSP